MKRKILPFILTALLLLNSSSPAYGAEPESEPPAAEEQTEEILAQDEESGMVLEENEEADSLEEESGPEEIPEENPEEIPQEALAETEVFEEETAEETGFAAPEGLKGRLDEEYLQDVEILETQEETGIPYSQSSDEKAAVMKVPVSAKYQYANAFQVVNLVNRERTSRGLKALKMDQDLLNAAMLRAAELSIYYSHTRPTGESCFTADPKIVGENIAAGTSNFYNSPSAVMQGWMASPGHKENILTKNYTSIGVGSIQIGGMSYWVQVFGTQSPKPAQAGDYQDGMRKTQVSFTKNNEGFQMVVGQIGNAQEVGTKSELVTGFFNTVTYTWLENRDFNFSSSNTAVCTVNASGILTRKRAGTSIITASLKNYPQAFVRAKTAVTDQKGQAEFRSTTPQVTAKANKDGSVKVSWKKVKNAYSYGIYRKEAGGTFKGLGITGSNAASFTDRTAKAGKTYYYTVKGFWEKDGKGISTRYPGNVSVKTPSETVKFANTIPQVTAKVNGDRSVTVNWKKVEKAASYRIYRKEAKGTFKSIATVGAGTVSYQDKTAQGGKTYYYTVKGFWEKDGKGIATKYPANINVTIPIDFDNPQEVFLNTSTEVAAEINADKSVTVSWEGVLNASSYRVYRKEAGGSFQGLATLGAEAFTYQDKEAKPGKTYYYTVKGFWEENARGIATKYPSDVMVKIPADSLAAPKVTLKSVNYCTIDVSWNAIEGAENYVIYRKEAKAGTAFRSIATVGSGTLKYRDGTAKLGVSYYYTVKACAGKVSSDYVKNVKGTAVPSAPTVKAAGSSRGVTVTWTGAKASADSYAAGYRIFRKTAGGNWKTVGTVGKNTRSFTDTTGTKGTRYYYTVRAYVKQSNGSNLWGSYNTTGVAGIKG